MLIAHIKACLACEHKAKDCNGSCPCTLDGKDIIWHASGNGCPADKFANLLHIKDESRAEQDVIEKRISLCQACEHFAGTTEKLMVKFAKCNACTTCEGGRSLTAASQTCPIKKW